jgi:aspartokinase/homoserine dehydrogenase 1
LQVVASAKEGSLRVGMQICAPDSPFYSLSGTDNMVAIVSDRYRPESPLVVRGAGAGPTVTAAGIVADLVKAARRCG